MSDSNQPIASSENAVFTGPAWAAIVSASLGCAAMGGFTLLSELKPRANSLLAFIKASGSLSGVTTLSLLVWIVSWALLHMMWKSRTIRFGGVMLFLSVLLILAGLLGTFPPFIDWLAHK